jgi:hypothetical protein
MVAKKYLKEMTLPGKQWQMRSPYDIRRTYGLDISLQSSRFEKSKLSIRLIQLDEYNPELLTK